MGSTLTLLTHGDAAYPIRYILPPLRCVSRVHPLKHSHVCIHSKLLAGLDAISNEDIDKSYSRNYQDIVTMSVDRTHDDDVIRMVRVEDTIEPGALGKVSRQLSYGLAYLCSQCL